MSRNIQEERFMRGRFIVRGLSSIVVLAGLVAGSLPSFALTCQQTRQLTGVYLKMHYSFRNFDDELSRRTFDSLIKAWDPGKVYFLEADVKDLQGKYETTLDNLVTSSPCEPFQVAIKEIADKYSERFKERQAIINKLIDDKHDFTVDEYLDIDRKKMPWAKTTEEVNERWRQRVKFQVLQLMGGVKDIKKVREKLHKRYELAIGEHNKTNMDQVYSGFLNAFAVSLDPHSEYMPADQLEEFRIQTRLSLEGIGAVLRSEEGFTSIQSMVKGGSAFESGKLAVDDKIVAVDNGDGQMVDVIDMELKDVVKLIRGKATTVVKLTILRDEPAGKKNRFVVAIPRKKIQLTDRIAKSKVVPITITEKPGEKPVERKIGFLTLPSFYLDFEGLHNREQNIRSSSADMAREITKLKSQNVDAIVLDLRSNGGGSLDESIKIAGMFTGRGPVVQIRQSDNSVDVKNDTDGKTLYDGPLVVMINRQSASASEIFAGAIQDHGRGIIIGDSHTFGKGTVQNLNDIGERLGATKITISKFYRPSGSSTQLRGVESDVVFPGLADEYEIGEKHYDFALPWEQIKASEFKTANLVTPYVAAVKAGSTKRMETDSGFQKINEEIKKYRESSEARSKVSLKEKKDDDKDKIAEDKKNEKKKDKKAKIIGDDEDGEVALEDDTYLQEGLRIAADYSQLMGKKSIGLVTIPQLEKAKQKTLLAERAAAKKAAKANKKKAVGKVEKPAAAPDKVIEQH